MAVATKQLSSLQQNCPETACPSAPNLQLLTSLMDV